MTDTAKSSTPGQTEPEKPNPVACKALDHVVLRVRDLEKAISFYEDVLGLSVERRLEELGLVQLRAGASLLDLVAVDSQLGKAGGGTLPPNAPNASPNSSSNSSSNYSPNMDHFAFTLALFDEDAIRQHLAQHGIEAGPTSTRYGAEGFGPSIYLRDLDGNTVELKGPPE